MAPNTPYVFFNCFSLNLLGGKSFSRCPVHMQVSYNSWVENVLNKNMPLGCICVVDIFIETARGILWQTHLFYGKFVSSSL